MATIEAIHDVVLAHAKDEDPLTADDFVNHIQQHIDPTVFESNRAVRDCCSQYRGMLGSNGQGGDNLKDIVARSKNLLQKHPRTGSM